MRSRKATAEWRIVSVAVVSAFLASCTTNGETTFNMASPAYAPGIAGVMEQAADEAASVKAADGSPPAAGDEQAQPAVQAEASPSQGTDKSLMSPQGDSELPQQIAYLPATNPATKFPAVPQAPSQQDAGSSDKESAPAAAKSDDAPAAPKAAASPAQAKADDTAKAESGVYVTATDPQQASAPIEAKKRGFLSSFFGSAPAAEAAQPARKATPIIELASTGPAKPVVKASLSGGATGGSENFLPGVRQEGLFEIKRKSGVDDDSDIDLHEDEGEGPVRVASAAGLARLAPNGLLTQTERVDVSCLKPSLVRVLKTVEQHYGKKIVVTSGYRSPAHNRRARGAKNSLHMYCAAADVQVPGISKWELAKFVRALPGRGGVGTYCHTESVHIDVGPERDWNWRCRRRQS